jgi:putative sugar O-methyltransferase
MIGSRVRYYLTKLKRARADGTLLERVNRKIVAGTRAKLATMLAYSRLDIDDKSLDADHGYADHRKDQNSDKNIDGELFDRLIDAYESAKAAQAAAPPQFEVRGYWAEWLELNYGSLIQAINLRDHDALNELLSNFAREQFAVGTGSSYDDVVLYKTSIIGRMHAKAVWCDYRDKLIDIGADLGSISHPLVGNPAGIQVNDSVIPIETLRHAYNAYSIAELLVDVPQPVIVEIGGGFGGQAYQTIDRLAKVSNPASKYLDFDIPEVLFVASYFLLKSFPDKRFRLFGEGKIKAEKDSDFDIGLFPHFTISELTDRSADLAFNSHSFSEMDAVTSSEYMRILNRVCARYLLHINHEVRLIVEQPDGSKSTNNIGSELVPDTRTFKRIYKRPRVYGRPEDRPFKSFAYLYERRRD